MNQRDAAIAAGLAAAGVVGVVLATRGGSGPPPPPSPPPTPTGLKATKVQATEVDLSCASALTASSYTLYRNGQALSPASSSPSFKDASVQPSTAYQYQVLASNQAGSSALSPAISVTTPVQGSVPPTPTGLKTTLVAAAEVDLACNASTGATAYTLFRNGVALSPSPSTPAFKDTSVKPATTYQYAVKAENNNGASTLSAAITVTTPPSSGNPPPTPTGLKATAILATAVSLSCNPSTGATSYTLVRNGAALSPSSSTPSFRDTSVSPSTPYSYQVFASNANGHSAASTPAVAVKTPAQGGNGTTFNVMNYGADPTGKTDSGTAFLNARLAAQKYGPGGTIYAPATKGGAYFISNVANTPGCISLEGPGIGLMGDGDDEFTGTKLLLGTAKIGPNGRRSGMIGIPAGSDGCAVGGLFVDGQSSPGNNTYPQIHNNPDPEILNVSSSHNRITDFSGRSGTGFCVRFVGASPCYNFTVGDNQYSGGTLEGLSFGGGFITLDVDCQGAFGPSIWTYIKGVSIFGQMAIYNDCYVNVDGLTFTPNKYNPPCAACVEITTTGKGPAHDLTFTNIVSNGGPIKVESYDGAPPIKNLILPSGQYFKCQG